MAHCLSRPHSDPHEIVQPLKTKTLKNNKKCRQTQFFLIIPFQRRSWQWKKTRQLLVTSHHDPLHGSILVQPHYFLLPSSQAELPSFEHLIQARTKYQIGLDFRFRPNPSTKSNGPNSIQPSMSTPVGMEWCGNFGYLSINWICFSSIIYPAGLHYVMCNITHDACYIDKSS